MTNTLPNKEKRLKNFSGLKIAHTCPGYQNIAENLQLLSYSHGEYITK